jgi:uncharacterized protein YdaT
MPYTKTDYPKQIKNLKSEAKNKWIEIFNSVYKKNNDEDVARQAAWKIIVNKYPNKSYIKESLTFGDILYGKKIMSENEFEKLIENESNPEEKIKRIELRIKEMNDKIKEYKNKISELRAKGY